MEPVEYQLFKKDFFDAYVIGRWRQYAKGFVCVALVIALLQLVPLVFDCGCRVITLDRVLGAASNGAIFAAFGCVACMALCGANAPLMARATDKVAKDSRVAWDQENLYLTSSYGSGAYPWPLFEKWSETRGVISLSLTPLHQFHFPKRDFLPDQLEALRAALKRAGVPNK